MILTNLIKYHYVMLHTCTLYKNSMPSSLIQEMFLCFAYINLCKASDASAGAFLNKATFNKLGKGLLDDNSYQISRLFACSGPDKRQCKECWGQPLRS